MRRIRSPSQLKRSSPSVVLKSSTEAEMLFNNLNKKSVWTLTGVELIEITLPFGE